MAVTVKALTQNVELTKLVHIVMSEISFPNPFIWQSLKDFIFPKLPDWVENYRTAPLNLIVSIGLASSAGNSSWYFRQQIRAAKRGASGGLRQRKKWRELPAIKWQYALTLRMLSAHNNFNASGRGVKLFVQQRFEMTSKTTAKINFSKRKYLWFPQWN